MHPWEFWEYSFDEFLQKRRGYYANERRRLRDEWRHFQFLSFYTLAAQGVIPKAKMNRPLDDIIPDIYAPQPDKQSIKELYESKRQAAKKRTENLKKRAGLNAKQPKHRR